MTVKVSMSVAEKVGLPNYSNVDIGPAVVERYVEDTPEAIKQGLAECLLHAQQIVFTEAEEVRRRGQSKPPTLEQVVNTVAPGSDDLTEEQGLRAQLVSEMIALVEANIPREERSPEARQRGLRITNNLIAWGVVNPRSPAEAVAALSVEKLPDLVKLLDTLKEGMNVPSA